MGRPAEPLGPAKGSRWTLREHMADSLAPLTRSAVGPWTHRAAPVVYARFSVPTLFHRPCARPTEGQFAVSARMPWP